MGGGESTVTSVNKTIPQYANGTSNHPGGMALVGEQGPELINLPRGSSVTNNTKTNSFFESGPELVNLPRGSNTTNNTTTNKIGGNSISVQGDSISINISGGGSPIDIWEQIKPKLDQYNRRKRERLIASLT
jgi:phage-related tail protein